MARETVHNCEEEDDPHERQVVLILTEGKLSEGEGGRAGLTLSLIPVIERKKYREIA